MSRAAGRSLELYYIDGHPDGMLTAELFNWTGHVLMAPRTQLATALARPEASCTGVYVLIGEMDGQSRAYIGEGEDIGARIRAHEVQKEWWTSAVLISAAANKLNKAHVRYLEARLIGEANSTGRVVLENGTRPAVPSLSEADIAKMEAFLENLLVVLPAVRIDLFIQRSRPSTSLAGQPATAQTQASVDATAQTSSTRFVLEAKKHGLLAHAALIDGEFIVEAGSTARSGWESAKSHSYAHLPEELSRAGILAVEGDHCRFTKNCKFGSPSAAAAVIVGRPANGQLDWKQVGTGLSYRDWEAGQLTETRVGDP